MAVARVARPSKYKAVPTNGYASKLEARHAARLKALMNAKDPKERVVRIEEQYDVPLTTYGRIVGTYVCDFVVVFADGREEWHECKGMETQLWKWKKRHFEAEYPDRKLVIIKK